MLRSEIKKQLDLIEIPFKGENDKKLYMHNFSSFLSCITPLPSNAKILSDFNNTDNITISQLGPMAHGKLKENAKYPETNFSFDDSEQSFSNEFMFVALNFSERLDAEKSHGAPWSNFHDKTKPANTYKLYLQINDSSFKGSYITDVLKDVVASNSNDIDRQFFLSNKKYSILDNNIEKLANKYIQLKKDKQYSFEYECDKVKYNQQRFNDCAEIFVKECRITRPKRLIVFGTKAEAALKKMLETTAFQNDNYVTTLVNHLVEVEHYSKTGKLFPWLKTYPRKLLNETNKQVVVNYKDF